MDSIFLAEPIQRIIISCMAFLCLCCFVGAAMWVVKKYE